MNKKCKHVKQDGFNCGSYAFNLYKDDIDQGDLCDVHYWQAKAQRTEQEPVAWYYPGGSPEQCTTNKAYAEMEPAWTPLYTTPQKENN
jgi:hypothetical protein